MSLLLENRSSISDTTNNTLWSLDGNVISDSDDIKSLIRKHPKYLETTDSNGRIPLHDACKFGYFDLVTYLIEQYPNGMLHSDFDGCIPLHEACKNGHADITKYLLQISTKLAEHKNIFGRLPLHEACSSSSTSNNNNNNNNTTTTNNNRSNTETVRAVLDSYKYGLRVRDNDGLFPLHHACRSGTLDTVKLLLTGFKIGSFQIKDNQHMFPIHHACIAGNIELVQYLWEQQPKNFNKKDKLDRYPIDVAKEYNHIHLIPFLEEKQKEINDSYNKLSETTATTSNIKNIIVSDEEQKQDEVVAVVFVHQMNDKYDGYKTTNMKDLESHTRIIESSDNNKNYTNKMTTLIREYTEQKEAAEEMVRKYSQATKDENLPIAHLVDIDIEKKNRSCPYLYGIIVLYPMRIYHTILHPGSPKSKRTTLVYGILLLAFLYYTIKYLFLSQQRLISV